MHIHAWSKNMILKRIIEDELTTKDIRKYRETVRAVVINGANQVLLIYSNRYNDYTFAGGGIKQGESHELALKRELFEELGAKEIAIISYMGCIEEIKYGILEDRYVYLQTSHFYTVTISSYEKTTLIGREKWHGIEPKWMMPYDAIVHNQKVMKDINHQQKGLKTVLQREEILLNILKEKLNHEKI